MGDFVFAVVSQKGSHVKLRRISEVHPENWTVFRPFLVHVRRLFVLTSPPFLELDRDEIPQGGVNALVHVDVVEKPSQLSRASV